MTCSSLRDDLLRRKSRGTSTSVSAVQGGNSHPLFVCNRTLDNFQIRLAHNKRIWRDCPADNALAQPPTGVDHDFVTIAGDWIGAKDDGGYLRHDQLLNEYCDLRAFRGKSFLTTKLQSAFRQQNPSSESLPG